MSRILHLDVLGTFSAHWSDGEPLELSTRKAQALLAYLAAANHGTTRERVANLLWGDRNDERARHNVRQVLSKIRSAVGPVIVSTGEQLTLDFDLCNVDLIEFLNLAEAADEPSLTRALHLYRGELLEGQSAREPEFEAWLLQARDRLQSAVCEVMDRLISTLRDKQRFDTAVDVLNRRLAIDPACEPAHRELMQILAETGRRSDAIRQYDACVAALERELGIEPSAEAKNLLATIRAETSAASIRLDPPVAGLAQETNKPKIAVLPFEKLSTDTDDYFADGITEDIITSLSRFHSLQVIARSSSFVYKGKDACAEEIAEALGARFLVRGSVQRSANRVRINVQLLDRRTGLNIWAHRFDRELTDVFLLQDEITATVVSTLADRVEATELARAREAPPERLEAYEYLLRGKDHHHRFSADDCAACLDMFGRAIERDPSYAVAHAWLACGLGQAMVFGLDEHAKLVDQSQAAAERGLALDENESECHRILAQVQLSRGNLARSLKHQERSLFLNPNDDRSICSMGEILTFAGRPEEGEQWVRKSLTLNPYHPQRYWTHLARAVFHLGRYAETLEILDQIGRPRRDDLAYAAAASVLAHDEKAVQRNVQALRVASPDFDTTAFVHSLPYERDEDRKLLLDALVAAKL